MVNVDVDVGVDAIRGGNRSSSAFGCCCSGERVSEGFRLKRGVVKDVVSLYFNQLG